MAQVSYIPGGNNQSGQGMQNQGEFVQLALAVKQTQMQEKNQKRQQALQTLDTMMGLFKQGIVPPPKEFDRVMKDAGLNYTVDQMATMSPDQWKQIQQEAAGAQGAGAQVGTPPSPGGAPAGLPSTIAPQDVTKAGKSMQPAAGAQSATPPSPAAAQAAPGGGVTPTAAAPSLVEHYVAQARSQFPQYAQMYQGVLSQQQIAAKQAEIENGIRDNMMSFQRNGDWGAFARARFLAGENLTDEHMRNIAMAAGPQAAHDYARAYSKVDPKAGERRAEVLKSLTANPSAISMFKDKNDILRVADAVAYNDPMPKDIAMNPFSIDQQKQMAEEAGKWIEYGFPPKMSWDIAEKRQMGFGINDIMPKGFDVELFKQGFVSSPERKMKIAEKEASAKMLQAQASMKQANVDASRLSLAEQEAKDKKPFQLLSQVIDMKKAGMDVPSSLEQEALASLTLITGADGKPALGMTVERKKNLLNYLSGGLFSDAYHYEFKPTPTGDKGQKVIDETAGPKQAGAAQGGFTSEMVGSAAVQTAVDIAKLPYRAMKAGYEAEKTAFEAVVGAAKGAKEEVKKRVKKIGAQ